MHLNAARFKQPFDVIKTHKTWSNFHAVRIVEGVRYVQTRQNYIAKDPWVWTNFMFGEMSDVFVLSGAQFSAV